VSTPTGYITTPGIPDNVEWEDITRYDDLIHKEADPVGWPMERVRGHIVIESGGDPRAMQNNLSNGPSYGLLQIVPYGVGWGGWHALVKEKAKLGPNANKASVVAALYDPPINIAVGVSILESFYQQFGTLDRASSAFFLGNPTWRGEDTVNGNSGLWYRDTLAALIAEQKTFAPPDPIAVIVGGDYPPIDYGWLADAGLTYYAYGVGHGTSRRTQHTGYDVGVPLGTRLYTPIAGVVDCVGGRGTARWGQGCGAYADTITGGVGNITIFGDSGHKLTLGHCNKSFVNPGERVAAGQQVGSSGGMNGPHCHVEVSVLRNGTYWLLDPGPALIAAMSGVAVPIPPPPVVYAERIPIPQPSEWDSGAIVTITRDGVPLLQRARKDALEVDSPWEEGDTFEAVMLVYTPEENAWYWVSRAGTRVPIAGTKSDLLRER
jgi:hypothetical protein